MTKPLSKVKLRLKPAENYLMRIRLAGLPEPVREYRFCRRLWRADFCWPEQRVMVEIQGGIYIGGRHVRPLGYSKDREKINTAQLLGWRVLEFTSNQISNGMAVRMTKEALESTDRLRVQRHSP